MILLLYKFDQTKDLPEEVILPLLNSHSTTQPEMDIFKFLVKWHDYQTKELGKSLQLTTKLFQNVRYFLIPPQLLLSSVIVNDLADKQLIVKAFNYLYNSPCPLGLYGDGSHQIPLEQFKSLSNCSIRTHWIAVSSYVSLKPVTIDKYDVSFCLLQVPVNSFAVKSMPLSNGMHSFRPYNLSLTFTPFDSKFSSGPHNLNMDGQMSIAIFNENESVWTYIW